jgi:hypothetical protein
MLTLGFKLILLLGEEMASLDLETVVPSLKVSIFWSSLLLKVVVEEEVAAACVRYGRR